MKLVKNFNFQLHPQYLSKKYLIIIWVSAMMPVALLYLPIETEDACLPVGREDPPQRGKPKRPIINSHQLYTCLFCPTGKVADNLV
jgi:hypothetical protein